MGEEKRVVAQNIDTELRNVKKELEKIENYKKQLKDEIDSHLEVLNFLRQAFASSGGKFRIAKKIVALMPNHKTYVEPFAGGASVYFAKEPSEVEVLNDKDKDVAFAYKFMKNISDAQIELLSKYKWTADKDHFYKLVKSKPLTNLERFYKFMYIRRFSFGAKGAGAGYGGTPNEKSTIVQRLPKIRERLKNTKIHNKDYSEIIKMYDSKDTFFYIDPPYPETTQAADWKQNNLVFTVEDLKKLKNILKTLKGKFILSIDKKNVNIFKGDFIVRQIKTSDLMNCDFVPRTEYIVLNYEPNKRKDFIKNVFDYDPKEVTNEQLADDWRIVAAWWSSKRQGKKIPYSYEDIANLAQIIYNEIVYRVKEGKMKHKFEPEKMKPYARELYEKISHTTFSEKKVKIKFLGTGPTEPILDKEGKSKRLRSSILINDTILVDATPDIDEQLSKEKLSAVIITHAHSDAIGGIPKLERYTNKDEPIPLYAFEHTINKIKKKFKKLDHIEFMPVEPEQQFVVDGITFKPIPVEHSVLQEGFDPTMALKIDNALYAEDVDEDFIFSKKGERFLDYLLRSEPVILDGAMCEGKIKGHCNIFSVMKKLLKHKFSGTIIFTQIGHSCPNYEILQKSIQKIYPKASVAYDGMTIEVRAFKFSKMRGIYLVKPHAELMWKGKKSLIVKSRNFVNMVLKPLFLIDSEHCYGIIKLEPAEPITAKEFEKTFEQHRITKNEAKEWWGDYDELYAYKFKWIQKFDTPMPIKYKKGTQTFADAVEFKSLSDMQTNDLLRLYFNVLANDRESDILQQILAIFVERGIMKNVVEKSLSDFKIIHGFISLIGSTAERGSGNDIDLLIRMSKPNDYLRRAIETRIRKMFPENIDEICPIHFVWGDEAGAHDTYIPLYDLALVRTEKKKVDMSKRIEKFKPYLPQKPKGSAYYDVDKLMKKLFGDEND